MKLKALSAAVASLGLMSASVQAAPVELSRASAPAEGEALAGGGLSDLALMGLLAAALIAFVVVAASDDDDADLPTSP